MVVADADAATMSPNPTADKATIATRDILVVPLWRTGFVGFAEKKSKRENFLHPWQRPGRLSPALALSTPANPPSPKWERAFVNVPSPQPGRRELPELLSLPPGVGQQA